MPSARAARAIAPRFSASFNPSSTAKRDPFAATSAIDGCSRRRATATTPRCRSNPTTVAITSLGATYTGTARSPSASRRVENRSTREGARSTDRISWPGFDQPVDGDEALGHEQLVALVRPPVRLVVQRAVVVEAGIVGVGERNRRTGLPRRQQRWRSRPGQWAKTWRSSANALNSSALPDGSRRNIVDCSPTSPANRVWGSMTNSTPAATRRSARPAPVGRVEQDAEVGHRHVVAVDLVAQRRSSAGRGEARGRDARRTGGRRGRSPPTTAPTVLRRSRGGRRRTRGRRRGRGPASPGGSAGAGDPRRP